MKLYLLLMAYAPRWLIRCLPKGWRHRQLRRWIAEQMNYEHD